MIENTNSCKDCENLVDKKRYTDPHENLIETNYIEVKSQFGNVDEVYYKCKVCSTTWLFEKGNYGEGWIKTNE